MTLSARFHDKTDSVPATQWDALLEEDDAPFLCHAFLSLLEESGSVGGDSGWEPLHLTLSEPSSPTILGAMPLYLKYHSYGEYVFDWAWARAYQQHGLRYYPKLVSAIPFTPVITRKLLGICGHEVEAVTQALDSLCGNNPLSSVHVNFVPEGEQKLLKAAGYLPRVDNQFHWYNRGYSSFPDFIAEFTSKKRKNIRQEREQLHKEGVRFKWLSGLDAGEKDWAEMYKLYVNTVSEHGGMPYLTETFFLGLPHSLGNKAHLLIGEQHGTHICSALFLSSHSTLYGRYWGSSRFVRHLHFETCYYQPIEFAIAEKLQRFEAGAQGMHKLSRGLEPTPTYSAHWLKHTEFSQAVENYLVMEREEQNEYAERLTAAAPFKRIRPLRS